VNNAKIVVIGTGFGGSMMALSLAERLKDGEGKILMLERGTW
jgi:choline dehydrogenase-like flavoprotein